MFRKSLFALLLLPMLAFGQDPTPAQEPNIITVPPMKSGEYKELTGKSGFPVLLSSGATPVYWVLIDDVGSSLQPINPDASGKSTSANFGSPTPGRYRIFAVGEKGAPARIAITLTGTLPDPTPKPDPVPNPGPVPNPPNPNPVPVEKKVAKFIIVEDTTKAGLWRSQILGSPKVRAFYTQLAKDSPTGLVHRIISMTDVLSTDPLVAKYQKLAAGKPLPYMFMLDSAGAPVKDLQMPMTDEAFVAAFEVHEGPRKYGLTVAPPKLKWNKVGSNPSVVQIPRSQWVEVNLGLCCPPVHDQDGVGQCASDAAVGTVEFARAFAGMPYVKLSAGDLYGRVNGGSDNGSLLEDNLAEILNHGVATAATVPAIWSPRFRPDKNKVDAERALYGVVEVYQCMDFDDMASAILQGFVVEHGMMWRDGFKVGSDGWLYNASGGRGGHAQMAYGLAFNKKTGKWGLITQNSWGLSWGGSADGTIKAGSEVVSEDLFDGQIGGFFAVRAAKQTPNNFPLSSNFRKLKPAKLGEFPLAF